MDAVKARTGVFNCLLLALFLGGLTAIMGLAGKEVANVASVDVILTSEELQDPKLIDVVYRTNRYSTSSRWISVFAWLGVGTAISAGAGLAYLHRLSRAQHSE
jgi:hypothetical protein